MYALLLFLLSLPDRHDGVEVTMGDFEKLWQISRMFFTEVLADEVTRLKMVGVVFFRRNQKFCKNEAPTKKRLNSNSHGYYLLN